MTSPERRRMSRAATAVTLLLGVLYTSTVLWVTLRPMPWATEGSEESLGILDPAAWTNVAAWTEGRPLEIALNVLMFVPIGVAAGLLMRGPGSLLVPIALTVGIELAQIPLDRISHPRDLVANALGGVIGVAFAAVVRRSSSSSVRLRSGAEEAAPIL